MSPTIVIPLSVPPFRCVNICFEYLDHPHGGSNSKKFACNAGDPDSIPGPGRFPGEGNSNPLQYSCLGNPMDRGAWRVAVLGVAKSRTRLGD